MVKDCEQLSALVREQLEQGIQARRLANGTCVLKLPFEGYDGEPIRVGVRETEGIYAIDDLGIIAGHLFSLGQHTTDTPALKLLSELADTYELSLDFDMGLIKATSSSSQLCDRVMEFAKVMITVLTATPHIMVAPHRLRKPGARLRAKIRKAYEVKQILEFVEPDCKIPGSAYEFWPIDFHWFVRQGEQAKHIYIVALDLDVLEPIQKIGRITSLAVDTKAQLRENTLRVVMDKHGHNSQSDIAATFLKQHSEALGFETYDFGEDLARDRFVRLSVDEILGEAGAEWRDLWTRRARFVP